MTLIIIIIIQIIAVCLLILILQKSNTTKVDSQSTEKKVIDTLQNFQNTLRQSEREGRQELSQIIQTLGDGIIRRQHEGTIVQKNQLDIFSNNLDKLTQKTTIELQNIRETVEKRLTLLQQDNNQKLEQMRATVDEKLQSTLEKRLSQSFATVSERLEVVHKGLGEMQVLASGVGDLKKILSNVKTRGTWGEVQLGNLLDQFLSRGQYETNVSTKKEGKGVVEYAIKLPGKSSHEYVWLPIDSKFPIEDYQRLIEAEDSNDKELINSATKTLETNLKVQAKKIQELYLDPPHTTDFALMFLPIEGLYAQALRIPGFFEMIQREYRVTITGPTTITAILNSLQMGFRTLTIQKQSSEIWTTLSQVKTEFSRFEDILEKTRKKLQEASNHIDSGSQRVRSIERKLRNVELPDNSDTVSLPSNAEE